MTNQAGPKRTAQLSSIISLSAATPGSREEAERWDLTVSSKRRLFDFPLRELIRYRDLLYMFFFRDFSVIYKQTILGPLWYIINPLCSTLVYAFVFGNIAGLGTGGVPFLLFYFGGTMLWTYFANCLNGAAEIFIKNAGTFGKVYFPRLTVPIATTCGALFKMLVQFVLLMLFLGYYIIRGNPTRPTLYALLFPLMILWIGALGTGCGMVVSSLTTKYRDLTLVLNLALSLAMFVTPVAYPLAEAPAQYLPFFSLNPMTAPVELFRIWFFGSGSLPPLMIVISLAETAAVVLLGLVLFTRTERDFMDVI